MTTSDAPLLEIDDLAISFRTREGTVYAIDQVSLSVSPGEMVGVVGESGSGKSVSAYALLRLLDNSAHVERGAALFNGIDLLTADSAIMRELRGAAISMVFQNPRTALSPTRAIGDQLTDVIMAHHRLGRTLARARALEALREVKITDPERRLRAFPFELSGGMCQRVMIALALACAPMLLIADEPTTGLDVTTQAAIMDLIAESCRKRRMAVLFITHDLALASEYCDRIVVMHAGQVVEVAPTGDLFEHPRHPYTRSLLAASITADATIGSLTPIPGTLPDLRSKDMPACRFAARCAVRQPRCDVERPPLIQRSGQHAVACWDWS